MFFDNENNILFFFSEIMITFFEFFFIILREKVFDRVSMVLPDLEIIIKRTFDNF